MSLLSAAAQQLTTGHAPHDVSWQFMSLVPSSVELRLAGAETVGLLVDGFVVEI